MRQFDAVSNGYLVASAPANENDPHDYSSLWMWRPRHERALKELIRFAGHKLEGINRTVWNGNSALLLAFDEEQSGMETGRMAKRQFGRLLLIEQGRFD